MIEQKIIQGAVKRQVIWLVAYVNVIKRSASISTDDKEINSNRLLWSLIISVPSFLTIRLKSPLLNFNSDAGEDTALRNA